jgi:hypothetical protein
MTTAQAFKICIIRLFMVLSVLFVMPKFSSALPSNRVKNITFNQQMTQEMVIVYTESRPEIKYFVLHNPERIVVDIKDAFVPQVNIYEKTEGDAIKGIRIGQNKKNIARIVLDINKDKQYDFKAITTMINGKPAVKIIVSLGPKNVKSGLAPFVFFDTEEIHTTISKESFKMTASKDLGESHILFNDTISNDIFNETGGGEKESDFSISGMLQLRTTLQTQKNDAVENDTSLKNRVIIESKYKNMLTLSVLSDYLYFGSEDETDEYDLDIYEAKWQATEKKYGFSIGKQIIRWGKTDQISPVDTLNPQDLREFFIPEYEERKIPIWMADAHLFFDKFALEGVFIPFFEESRIDYFGTNWSIFGHVKKELQNAPISPPLKTYFENINVNENSPDSEAEFALRLTSTIKNIDLGFSFHNTTEDTPYFKSFPVKNINVNGYFSADTLTSALVTGTVRLTNEDIEVEYKRTNIAGFEFETILSDFGVRGEAAWQENQSFLTSSLTSTRKPTLFYVVGADYTTKGNMCLNLQFAHRHIYSYNPDILYFDQDTYSLIGEIRQDIISDWLEASLKYSKTLNNNSWYLSPQLKYTYIKNLECIIGASIFAGDRDTWLGRFKDYDLLFFDISYRF